MTVVGILFRGDKMIGAIKEKSALLRHGNRLCKVFYHVIEANERNKVVVKGVVDVCSQEFLKIIKGQGLLERVLAVREEIDDAVETFNAGCRIQMQKKEPEPFLVIEESRRRLCETMRRELEIRREK